MPVTDRLDLNPLTASDAGDLFAARGDAEVMAYWDALPDANPSETAAVVSFFLDEMRSGTALYWSLRLRQDGTFIGVCDLSEIQPGESAEAGFMLLRKYWGLGYGREVLHWLIEFSPSLGLKRVEARIHSSNQRSRRLLLKAGFQGVREMPRYEIRPGIFRDCIQLELQLAGVSLPQQADRL